MEDFAKMLRRSAYQEIYLHEIISDAIRGFREKARRRKEEGLWTDQGRGGEEKRRRGRVFIERRREEQEQERASSKCLLLLMAKEILRFCKEQV